MAVQRLEKGLKAASDKAAEKWTVSLDLADSRCSLYVLDGRGTDETDLNSPHRYALFGHARQPRRGGPSAESVELPIRYLHPRVQC